MIKNQKTKDFVIQNKLRLLKNNMIRSGNADIANITDMTEFHHQPSGIKEDSQLALVAKPPKIQLQLPTWRQGAIHSKNRKIVESEARKAKV